MFLQRYHGNHEKFQIEWDSHDVYLFVVFLVAVGSVVIPLFIPYIAYLWFLSLSLFKSISPALNFIIFTEQPFVCFDSSVFYLIHFCSHLHHFLHSNLLHFDLLFSSWVGCLSLIVDLPSLLICVFSATCFHVSTTLVAFYKLWCIELPLSFNSKYFLISIVIPYLTC